MPSKNAIKLLKNRYCKNGEQPKDVYKRVAAGLALGDDKFENKLHKAMNHGYFLPNSPCLMNAGTKKGLLHACFCLPCEDDMRSIFETITNTAEIFKSGGGVGINFSELRPKGDLLNSGGTSSGAVSFMGIFNTITEVVKQGGRRRGALMGILDYNHPEILEFITSKLEGNLTNFNISVMVTDNFMERVEKNEDVRLIYKDKVWTKTSAKNIFDALCFGAWKRGDPGLLFYDRINQDNPYYPELKINTTNPCFTGDTKIETLYGQIPIKDLVGKETLVYCYDGKKNNISKMFNIRKTGIKQEVWKVTLDNDEEIKVTPNHLFMLRDGTYKEVKDLQVGESLMPFYRYKRNSKGYNQLALNNGEQIGEAQFVCEWKYGRKMKKGECCHHIDRNKTNNSPENLEFKSFSKHSSEHIKGDKNPLRKYKWLREQYSRNYKSKMVGAENPRWDDPISIEEVVKLHNLGLSQSKIAKKLNTTERIVSKRLKLAKNHKIKKIEFYGYEDVYDGEVEKYHNFALAAGIMVHNCSEVALFHYTACCLGSLNLTKFIRGNKFNHSKFKEYLELATRTLLTMNEISHYPLEVITKTMKEFNPIGVGIMGFSDTLIRLGIYYDSDACLEFIEEIGKTYKEVTDKKAKNSFYKRIIAPTGSLSILADCSSGVEPVFERNFERHLTVGVIHEIRDLYKSKYCRTAHEITPEWHLKIQAKWQEQLDGGLSKTINLPNSATIDDVRNIYLQAWKSKVKGITVFRDGCMEGVLRKVSSCDGEVCHL